MSVEAITWALKQPIKHSTAKFVLVAIANCADSVDGVAWPSVAYLCEATGQDRKTVLANTKRLADLGYLVDTGERKGTTKSVVVYKLSEPKNGTSKQSQKRDTSTAEAVPFFPASSTVFPCKQSQFSVEAVPKTGHGTVKEPSIEPSGNKRKAQAPVIPAWIPVDAWNGYVDMRKKNRKPMTDRAIELKFKELENFKNQGFDIAAILDKSTSNNWTDIYPQKKQFGVSQTTGLNPQEALEASNRAVAQRFLAKRRAINASA